MEYFWTLEINLEWKPDLETYSESKAVKNISRLYWTICTGEHNVVQGKIFNFLILPPQMWVLIVLYHCKLNILVFWIVCWQVDLFIFHSSNHKLIYITDYVFINKVTNAGLFLSTAFPLVSCCSQWFPSQSGSLSVFFVSEGFFLLLNGSGSKDGEIAAISVPVITLTSHICVGFWYHMLGPSVSTLDLLVETVCTLVCTTTNLLSQALSALLFSYNDLLWSRNPLKS